jgi:hypothetical protein
MTVGELREILQDMDDEAEVRLAIQPSYPLELSVREAFATNEIHGPIYLGEGSQIGYLPGEIARGFGWR